MIVSLIDALKYATGKKTALDPSVSLWGNNIGLPDKSFWDRDSYAVGSPANATEPWLHFLCAYKEAVSMAPNESALDKLVRDNAAELFYAIEQHARYYSLEETAIFAGLAIARQLHMNWGRRNIGGRT